MKVYIVIECKDENTRILDLYLTKRAAIERVVRLGNRRLVTDQTTYHVVSKSVKGVSEFTVLTNHRNGTTKQILVLNN